MRLVCYADARGPRTGVLTSSGMVDAHAAMTGLTSFAEPGDVLTLLRAAPGLRAELAVAAARATPVGPHELLPPLAAPPKIICCWVNYLEEGAKPPSEKPIFFGKFNTALIGDGDTIRLPAIAHSIVVEPELAVVIGTAGRHIPVDVAMSLVGGYTIANDVTAFSHRLIDLIGSRGPNMMAKTFDTFCPMGPAIVTPDEVPDPHALRIRQWLNGQLETDASSAQMQTRIPEFISYLSGFFTLQPGDVLLTGSPKPLGQLKYLAPGDVVRIEIEGIGTLTNVAAAESP